MSPVPLRMDVRPKPVSPTPLPPAVESKDERLSEVLDALRALSVPAPIVEPPDLSDIVTAVTSLKPGPTAAEIAAAIADVLQPSVSEDSGAPLREVAEALTKLDFRLQGLGRQAYGGGSVHLESGQTFQVSNAVYDPVSTIATVVAASGSTTLHTPSSGQKMRVRWLYAQSDPSNSSTMEVTFRLGATDIYYFELDIGQSFAHSAVILGSTDAALSVFTNSVQRLYVNADYQEIA